MLNRVRLAARRLTAASGRCACQCALLVEARPAIAKLGGYPLLVAVVVLAVVLLVAVVVLAAVFSDKPARRRAALAVLDRILRYRDAR